MLGSEITLKLLCIQNKGSRRKEEALGISKSSGGGERSTQEAEGSPQVTGAVWGRREGGAEGAASALS